MVVTPSFMERAISFSNLIFSNCSRIMDAEFVKLTSDGFYGNGVQYEHSILLSPVLL
jgi:hypothetical protein